MKKKFIWFIQFVILITACAASPRSDASTPTANGGLTLDQAISEAVLEIDKRISAGVRIAPVNFSSTTDILSRYVLDEITVNLVNTSHLTVIDRTEIDLRRKELNFQMSGEVSDASMQSLGRTLGAQSIISGSLTAISGNYRVVIRVLNVESGKVEAMYRNDINNDNRLSSLLKGDVVKEKIYKIGEFGPAGGYVFYDKGVFSGGWRYLEAAPLELEFFAMWGGAGNNINGWQIAVGSGKQNTQIIIRAMERLGVTDSAAQLCAKINYDGFNDWFLPNMAELELMYTNLFLKGLGGFEYQYWASQEYSDDYGQLMSFSRDLDRNQRRSYYPKDVDDIVAVRPIRAF